MRWRKDLRPRAGAGAEVEPEPGRALAERVRVHLEHPVAETLDRERGVPRNHVQHRVLQRRVALAHHLVHHRARHPRLLEQAKRLTGLDRAKLPTIAHQHQPRRPGPARDPHQRAHLRRADHRRLVDDHEAAAEHLPCAGHQPRPGDAVADVAVAQQKPLQGSGSHAGLAREHSGRARRRGEAHDPPLAARELHHRAKHRGLARPRIALHADEAVGRKQHRTHRFALAGVEPARGEPGLDAGLRSQPRARPDPFAHPGDDVAFRGERPTGHEGKIRSPCRRLDQVAVPTKRPDRRVHVAERVSPRRHGERPGAQLVRSEHGAALLEMLYRAPRDHERRRRRRRSPRRAPAAPCRLPVPREVELSDAQPPCLLELAPFRLLLPLACVQHRLLHPFGRVVEVPLRHPCKRFPAPRREALERRPAVARNLEARHPAYHRRRRRVAHLLEPASQLVTVVRPNQLLRALQGGELGASPAPRAVAGHVRDHAVRVQLRVEVATRTVTEGRRHQPVGLHPGALAGGGIISAGLEQLRLDEVEGCAHRLVMRPHHPRPGAGARENQGLERYRLRCREGHVDAGPVLVRPVPEPPEPQPAPRHMTLEHLLESLRFDRSVQPERRGGLAVPAARLAVLGVVLRVVAVGLEVMHRRGGHLEAGDGRDHDRAPFSLLSPHGA